MKTVNVHASCVILARAGETLGAPPDAGVLLLGDSGAGKSDLALRLIHGGATLVSDDRSELFLRRGELWARAPARLAGMIEVRGVGILTSPFDAEARIALAVQLVEPAKVPRLPEFTRYEPPQCLHVPSDSYPPLLLLAPFETSAAAKVAVAAASLSQAPFHAQIKLV